MNKTVFNIVMINLISTRTRFSGGGGGGVGGGGWGGGEEGMHSSCQIPQ